MSSRRNGGTGRREAILEVALAAFTERGFERTTMRELRRRSGASTGSLYHHFATKEAIAAELYVDGICSAQAFRLVALRRTRDAESGVRAFVAAYLRWVSRHAALASFLLNTRHADYVAAGRLQVSRLNREFDEAVAGWAAPYVAAGRLVDVPPDVLRAFLTGPSDHFARQWLAGATQTSLTRAAREVAELTWRGISARRRGRGANDRCVSRRAAGPRPPRPSGRGGSP